MNRLYLYGGLFHSDPSMSEVWERLDPGTQKTIEWSFRNYEGRVRPPQEVTWWRASQP